MPTRVQSQRIQKLTFSKRQRLLGRKCTGEEYTEASVRVASCKTEISFKQKTTPRDSEYRRADFYSGVDMEAARRAKDR